MKANHELLMKAAELGILRSMPDFLEEPLKPGRLKRRFLEVGMIVDVELRNMFNKYPNFYKDNLQEITVYLEKFGKIMNVDNLNKEDIHVASIVCFCLNFLEETETKYPDKLFTYLKDILYYYENGNNIKYSDFMKGRKFHKEWEEINNG